MDAEEVEHERGQGEERRDVVLIERVAVEQAEFIHGGGRLFCRQAAEDDFGRGPRRELDDVVINALELPRVAAGALAKGVQTFESVGRDGKFGVARVDFVQRAAIALHFLLGTVSRSGVAQHERAQTVGGDGDALDTIGRFRALNEGHLAECLQHLRRQAGEQLLFAFGLGNVVEQPRRAHGQGVVADTLIAESHHGLGSTWKKQFNHGRTRTSTDTKKMEQYGPSPRK
jgi:hypothetical protein